MLTFTKKFVKENGTCFTVIYCMLQKCQSAMYETSIYVTRIVYKDSNLFCLLFQNLMGAIIEAPNIGYLLKFWFYYSISNSEMRSILFKLDVRQKHCL